MQRLKASGNVSGLLAEKAYEHLQGYVLELVSDSLLDCGVRRGVDRACRLIQH